MDKYEIPKSWEWTTLDEVFFIERGGSPRPIKSFLTDDENGINWIKIGDVAKGQKYIESTKEKIKPEGLKKSRLVVEGDFILSNSMSFGRPYIVKTEGAIHDGWLVFRDVTKELNKDFFYYLLSSSYIYQQFSRNASGSTVKNLNIEIVKQTNISLPPLNEQKRIVSKIEKLFSNLDNSDKYLLHLEKQLKRYRQSVLKSAFEGELTREWRKKQTGLESADELLEKIKLERIEYIESEIREKFQDKTEKWIKSKVEKEVEKFYNKLKPIENDEQPFSVPKEWQWVRFDQISKKIGDIDHKMPKSVDKGYPYIATQNFARKREIDFYNAKQISEEDFYKLSKKIKPEYHDIIFPRYGTIGENFLVNINKDFLVSYSCAIIKGFSKAVYNPKYSFLYSISPIIKDEIKRYINETTQANVGIASIKLFLVALPPLQEQEEIVKQIEKHFSIIDKLEATVQKSIKESKRLRQSILKQAFEGKLVEQDPSDESASLLLEKIAKAKEAYKQAQKEQKKRKK